VRGGLLQVARIAGLTTEKVDQCIANKDEQDRINQVSQDGQLKYGLNAVPAFVINGTLWEAGGVDWPKLKEKLDSLLSKH
ncbi:MAG TPA: thioredoxin domain-containing protein, partial [Rhizomicrobium sp.]